MLGPYAGVDDADHNAFAGFVLDYGTPNGYAKRVWLGIGMLDKNRNDQECLTNTKPPGTIEYHDVGARKHYRLNLAEWAPANWNGNVWFTVGIQNAGKNSSIKVLVIRGKE